MLADDAVNSRPLIKAYLYFDAPPVSPGDGDGTLTSPTVLAAFKNSVLQPWLMHSWVAGQYPNSMFPFTWPGPTDPYFYQCPGF
jgi:hypothetical protein